MPAVVVVCLIVSFTGLALLFLLDYRRGLPRRVFSIRMLVLTLAGVVLVWLFGDRGLVAKSGKDSDLAFAAVLYLFMVLGMLAHYGYHRFEQPKAKRPPFDWGSFLAPVFASPIVVMPLLVALQNARLDLARLDLPRIMLFVVAFENGFFWKEYFDRRRREKSKDGS